MTARILLIDGDETIVESMQPVLTREGYWVDHALPHLNAIRKMLLDEPDLVILGVDPPEDGWQFCQQVLAFLEKPLLLLLSTEREADRIRGLTLGAADCVDKSASMVELVARVKALLRRTAMSNPSRQSLFVDHDLEVDSDRREVWLGGDPVALTPTEFCILAYLVDHAGEVVSHEQLMEHVWGAECGGSTELLKPHIHHLRRKLEREPTLPRRIVTCWGRGYSFRRIAPSA